MENRTSVYMNFNSRSYISINGEENRVYVAAYILLPESPTDVEEQFEIISNEKIRYCDKDHAIGEQCDSIKEVNIKKSRLSEKIGDDAYYLTYYMSNEYRRHYPLTYTRLSFDKYYQILIFRKNNVIIKITNSSDLDKSDLGLLEKIAKEIENRI